MSSSWGKSALIGTWLLAIAGIGYFLFHEDRFFGFTGTPVASVVKMTRDVTYRSEDDTRWKRISGKKQSVFDGDRIATGRASGAVIDFGDGRLANLGEDSSLTLNTIRQTSGVTYVLSLPKGSVAIQTVKKSQRKTTAPSNPIIVRAAGRDYLIEPGEERGIVRDSGGVREFKGARRPKSIKDEIVSEPPMETPVPEVISIALLEDVPPPPPAPPPPAPEEPKKALPPPPPPDPEVIGTEIKPDTSDLKSTYFTFESLASVTGELGAIGWTEPEDMPPEWSPVFELSNGNEKKRIILRKGGTFKLSLSNFGPLTASTEKDGVPCAVVGLRGGARVKTKLKQNWAFSEDTVEIVICSYRDAVKNVPLIVGLSSIDGGDEKREGIFPAPSKSELQFQMVVTTPSQYLSLLPMIASSENIRVAKSQGLAANGTFVAKSGKVIMQLAGSGFDAKAANTIRAFLKGDLVFRGPRTSLYDASALSIDELKGWVSQNTKSGKKVFINRKGSLFPINRDFLEQRSEVAAFVKSLSSEMFTEKVQILSIK